jgi:hypothetical protein
MQTCDLYIKVYLSEIKFYTQSLCKQILKESRLSFLNQNSLRDITMMGFFHFFFLQS